MSRNGLILGTKNEDLKLISYVESAEYNTANSMSIYFKEMFQNFRRANGHLYTAADLEKLNLERRPAFVYNLFRPILLQLAGNFKSNMGKIEALPRTPGDFKMASISNDLLDYALITANNIEYEMVMSYINAIIGRIGWVYSDWRYDLDPEGMFWVENYNPFRVLFDVSNPTRNTKKWNYIIDRGFYNPEEICNIFASDDMDMWDEITEKAKVMLGSSDIRNKQILSMIERVAGVQLNYKGKETGYDEFDAAFTNLNYGSTEYYDTQTGRFKVIDFHERRSEQIFVATIGSGEEWDITKYVQDLCKKAKEKSDIYGSGYKNAIAEVRNRIIAGGFGEPKIERRVINQIYQTAVCPALNIVLSDEPYKVQNGNFKLTPVFCFEMGQEILEWKSYIDDLVDPVRGFTLNMNTMQTYLMKSATGETWYEDDALEEYEDDFKTNTIDGFKKVKPRALREKKIQRHYPPTLPPGLSNLAMIQEELVKKTSGVRDNALGTRENSSESGKLFQSRIAQTDLLQVIPQDNAISQMRIIGENCADNLFYYLAPGRAIRILNDETNPYWIEIHQGAIKKLFYDRKTGELANEEILPGKLGASKYDIIISQVPYGQAAKERDYQELMGLAELALKMQKPEYIKYDYFVKRSNIKEKEELLTHIKAVDQNSTGMIQQQMAQQEQATQMQGAKEVMGLEKEKLDLEGKQLENLNKRREILADQQIESAINQLI